MRRYLFSALIAIASVSACTPKSEPKADNTAQNKRDRAVTPTADNAVTTGADLDTTQKIRKAVVDDSTLSTNAHNCKIVVQDGLVTLVGPVASRDESARVEQIAAVVVGDRTKISNQLQVAN